MMQHQRRRISGSTTMELAMGLPFFIAVTIFSINTAAFVFAADFCDRTCKDCARAAGQMPTPDESVNAMNAAAAAHPVDNFFFQQLTPELLVYRDYNSTSTPTPAYGRTSEYNGENGADDNKPATDDGSTALAPAQREGDANIDTILRDPNQTITPGPYVVVRTTMLMRIPVSVNFFGYKLFSGNVEGNPQLFQFQSIYTFPITNTYVPL